MSKPAFDPGNEFDAMADWFRVRIAELALEADKAAIYRGLGDRQLECFMAGAVTGVVGVCLAMTASQSHDDLMDAIAAYLPEARLNADGIVAPSKGEGA